VILLWLEMDEFALAIQSRNWPAANGTVLKSEIENHVDVHGNHSTAKIEYAYRVNGMRYENNTIAFGLVRSGYAANEVATWPKGKATVVYYEPAHPAVSCLKRGGIGWDDCFLFLLGVLGVALGTNTATIFLGRCWTASRSQAPDSSTNTW
jgi:hypothetical protein